MNTRDKIEEVKYAINRYDHYYESINSKGTLYLTINTFILGGVITGYYVLNESMHFGVWILILFILTLASNIALFVVTLLVISPYLNRSKSCNSGSLLYFGDIATLTREQINDNWKSLRKHKWKEHLIHQQHLLAKGLARKFNLLHWATWLIGFQVLLIVLFGIILLTF